ncbi:MAG: hypothetical protein WCE68_10335 [Anaerolineales bacterium]
MNKKHIAFWVVAMILLVGFSFLLSGLVQDTVVLPIVKFAWILKGYFGSLPQAVIWGIVVTASLIIAGFSLRTASFTFHSRGQRAEKMLGQVGDLSFWIGRSKDGPYPRWYVAHTLAELALELLRRRGVDPGHGEQLKGPGWSPPKDVQAYLEIALRSTPASFARQLNFAQMPDLPDTESIIKYLESYAENSND